MKDPERLLSAAGDGDDFERELLGSLRGAAPPLGAKAEAWGKIGSQIAAAALVGGTVGSVPPNAGGTGIVTAMAKLSATKLALVIATAAVVLGGGAVVVHHRTSPRPVAAPSAIASPTVNDPPELVPAGDDRSPVVVSHPRRAEAGRIPGRAESGRRRGTGSDRLSAESALLTAARAGAGGRRPESGRRRRWRACRPSSPWSALARAARSWPSRRSRRTGKSEGRGATSARVHRRPS